MIVYHSIVIVVLYNKHENEKRIPHQYKVGDQVSKTRPGMQSKLSRKRDGPYEVIAVYNNGTIRIRRGAITERLNIRRVTPFEEWAPRHIRMTVGKRVQYTIRDQFPHTTKVNIFYYFNSSLKLFMSPTGIQDSQENARWDPCGSLVESIQWDPAILESKIHF